MSKDYASNGFPAKKGKLNQESGINVAGLYLCVADGEVAINWATGGSETLAFLAGDAYDLSENVASVTINSGKFHVA